MFGICLWYKIVPDKGSWKTHAQTIIDRIRVVLRSHQLLAHITIRSNIADIRQTYNYYKSIPKPYFKVGELEQTCTIGSRGRKFFALQRKLYLNGATWQVSTYHLSFAYRDTPFTDHEMDMCRRETGILDRIESNEIDLQVWNCQDVNPALWQQVNMS